MKNNKIINSRRTTRHRKLIDWQHVYQADECALHGS